jgi:malonyl CoA-acyl carrier protein transacylase
MGIREDAKHTLRSIAAHRASTRHLADGPTLQELTGLDPERLNDAIDQLEHDSFLKVERAYNTQPFTLWLLS